MTITYQREPYSDALAAATMELMRLHYEEIAEDKDLLTLDPDLETYKKFEEKKQLMFLTTRDDGNLVGYITMILVRNLHYKQVIFAQNDGHFLKKELRNGSVGYRMIRAGLRECKRMGAHIATLRTKDKHNHGKLFERLGGRLLDHVYIVRLTDGEWGNGD